ncbi:glycosyl hydrolase 115 family protein [Aridibaculum aurantiacum]|uniref:glycosyl hydrolase 115 family protein n=1 Tax=Aridibaculum aurantiacum TaxID=2810307 RepID=UPI001A9615F0|nr:glycosyl hydrolase 115 family protein [Aridibaculum aurantiacum]
MKKIITMVILCFAVKQTIAQQMISDRMVKTGFAIVSPNAAAPIYVDARDHAVVKKAAELLQQDIEMVTGKKPTVAYTNPAASNVIIIGTVGSSSVIDRLVKQKKLKLDKLKGKWEAYQLQVVADPFPGVDNALVIAGSDRRGTAYGAFELSAKMGVSAWYYWADVPVKKKELIYYTGGTITDAPAVKYRGIFINDEAPALSNWSREKFGGFNSKFYAKVFELMLRLKSNYLWPAMWGSAFYDDDKLNKQTADEYAIVIGTSHHEPLMRAHDEWRRFGEGKWNYDSNATRLQQFWKAGMERVQGTETIVSVGMRGDGDEPMTQGTAIALLEKIVKDQREIIAEVTGKPASETPQLWALYKEVQEYYDKGMRVPDDVTLLLCDDNWGNIRKLPKLNEKPRKGGYGIYYHFDYVGGPRNYKWINTNNIARVWEQMHLAWKYNARQIWIVNVGDIKPMEFPTSFFLDYAWNPNKWNESNLQQYYTQWAAQQFGEQHAKEIGIINQKFSQYIARRKPELLDANTYSIHNYNEASRVVNEWDALQQQAEAVNNLLPAEHKDAYFQLILHPIQAAANLHRMYVAVAYNRWFASNKWAAANMHADRAKLYYINDSLITRQYHTINNGKWNHMMSQTHIGYTYWQQPPFNSMPEVKYVSPDSAVEQASRITGKSNTAESMVPANVKGNIFYEKDGYVSMEASNWTKANNSNKINFKVIPGIGRTGDGVTTFPVTATALLAANSTHLQYEFYSYDTGKLSLNLYFSPTLNFHNNEGLKYAVSIDDEKPQVISINKDDENQAKWGSWVANNVIVKATQYSSKKPGKHVLKYWAISPGVVLQKLVVDFGGVKQSYLGPPETLLKK